MEKVFSDDVFPLLDEDRFSVLYSSNLASKPNSPINAIVVTEIIKMIFDYSDDEMVVNLVLNHRFQLALHTTSYEEQPLSIKGLSWFCRWCYDYERIYGVDLYHGCVTGLPKQRPR